MRRLTVLSVAYALAPAGPDAVGGAEQVLSALDHALVAAGHRSIVVACAGSEVAGTLLDYPAPDIGQPLADARAAERHGWVRARAAEAMATAAVDVIHMHGLDFLDTLPPPGPPVLATLHLPPAWYPAEALAPARPGTWVHGVSATQAATIPASPQVLPPITNGVPVDRLGALSLSRRNYALVLARICPEKGVHLALEAAHRAGVTLLIGGEVFPYPAHQEYFRTHVEPLLDRRRRYLGPVDFNRKRRLLAAAGCLLVPSLAEETSSLVAMEAASCGTAVVAFRRGALPEVVEEGRTGFLVDDVAGMVAALGRVAAIDHGLCRETARRRFGHDRMAGEYISRYQQLASHSVSAAA